MMKWYQHVSLSSLNLYSRVVSNFHHYLQRGFQLQNLTANTSVVPWPLPSILVTSSSFVFNFSLVVTNSGMHLRFCWFLFHFRLLLSFFLFRFYRQLLLRRRRLLLCKFIVNNLTQQIILVSDFLCLILL